MRFYASRFFLFFYLKIFILKYGLTNNIGNLYVSVY